MRRVRVRSVGGVVGIGLLVLVVAGAVQAGVSRLGGSAPVGKDGGVVGPGGTDSSGRATAAPAVTDGAGPAASLATPAPVPGGTSIVPSADPKVVRTADVQVQVAAGAFASAFDRVASIAAANGGFVASSSATTGGKARAGTMEIRVPADRFDAARQAVRGLGKVETESLRGQDVTGQLVDFDARLTSLKAQEDALRTLLGQAKAVGDVLTVQSNLFNVRQQIEQLQAQRTNLDQQASFATIAVALAEPGAVGVTQPPKPDRGLAHSWRQAVDGALAVAGGMIVVVGWLAPFAVLGLAGWAISRGLRRRSPGRLPAT